MSTQPYAVLVSLTRGRKVVAVASFDKPQAEAALEILSLPDGLRQSHAQSLLSVLPKVKGSQKILATPTTRTGLVRKTPVMLPKRVAYFIAKACLEPNGEGVECLKKDLERISAGILQPDQIRHPFLASEGFKPKS